jgi:hypothetical protein
VVVNDVESLIKNCGDMGAENKETRYAAVINAINIMHSISKFDNEKTKEWMEKKENMTWFKLVGKNLELHLRNNTLPPNLRLAAEQAGEQLMVIFTKFLEYHPKDLDALFSLVESVTAEDFKPSQHSSNIFTITSSAPTPSITGRLWSCAVWRYTLARRFAEDEDFPAPQSRQSHHCYGRHADFQANPVPREALA